MCALCVERVTCTPMPLPALLTRPTALVVDDLRLNRLVLAACLKKLGFNVLEAANGLEGVNVFEQQQQSSGPLAIIITDLQMPDADDGLLLTRAVRAMEEARSYIRTPLVICTASSIGNELLEKAAKDGADQAVSKPMCMSAVTSILNRHLPGWEGTVPRS